MEKWYKLWEYTDKQSKLWIPGDTIYVSNKGRVKLNDEMLSIGHGLWMSENGDINIVGRGFGKYKTIYRFIYTMTIEPTFNGGHKWQIHHIDRDHSNNNSDNLIKVTARAHLKIHSEDQYDIDLLNRLKQLKQYYKEQSDKRYEHIAAFKQWLSERYNKYYNEVVVPNKEQQRKEYFKRLELQKEQTKQRNIERKQLKLIKEQQLIDAGTHFRAKDGRLMSYQQIHNMHASPRDNSYITDEWRQSMSEKQKQLVADGKNTGKASTLEKEKLRKERISKALLGKKYNKNN